MSTEKSIFCRFLIEAQRYGGPMSIPEPKWDIT